MSEQKFSSGHKPSVSVNHQSGPSLQVTERKASINRIDLKLPPKKAHHEAGKGKNKYREIQ